jgi:hypothetical protein
MKKYTVIAENWETETGLTFQVEALNPDENDIRIWGVIEGWVENLVN